MTSDWRNEKKGKSKFWDRYQDMMLVGDHGQVIPFQRFKKLATVVVVGLIVSLILVVVLGALLAGGFHKYNSLKNTLKETQQQLAQMRDEKDLLLTQMVIKKKRAGVNSTVESQKATPETPSQEAGPTPGAASKVPPDISTSNQKEEPPPPPEKVPVELSADVSNIKVYYQSDREVLSISFKIFNTSKPKESLAGRSVVVFKNQDEPPIKWLAVPRVQLINGKPSGKRGKAFKINNYRTEKLRAYRQKAPINYNMATIFIYSSNGELLLSKDHGFEIDVKPSPKPIIPPPKPAKEPSKPPVVPPQPVVQPAPPQSVTPAEQPAPPQPVTPTGQTAPSQPTPSGAAAHGAYNNPGSIENDASAATATQSENQSTAAPSRQSLPTPENSIGREISSETDASPIEGEHIPQPTTQGE